MPLSWNEIRTRAIAFSKEYEGETREHAEAKSFWDAFFNVFGISRRRLATFEEPVKKLNEQYGFIDLFWKGTLLVEHKSKGKDLNKAYDQALNYFSGLKENELPRYVLVSDFERFRLYDLDDNELEEFDLKDLQKNIKAFGFMLGYETNKTTEQDPVNIKAAELMGKLHDALEDSGYSGHDLEVYLVRLLFCLFADDTGIFDKDSFVQYIEHRTAGDGSDLAMHLSKIFEVLNKPPDGRLKNLDEELQSLPYVNGKLFEERLGIAAFDSAMRRTLIDCCYLDWGQISPAIFGSLFQSVMDPQERRNLGAHYTSEKNILKLIGPLFLDELKEEFEKLRGAKQMQAYHKKLSELRFLDPACGCGNFLVITYRELRLLELELLRKMHKSGQGFLDVSEIIWVDVDQFYGIEIDEWPARIAEVALWLMDHQMNLLISEEFGQYFARLPLKKSATIVHDNALRLDWKEVIAPEDLSYILGNPPFIGSKYMTNEMREEIKEIFPNGKRSGTLDYVCGWYGKASEYINGTDILVAFVSTNSISQGEQVGELWGWMLENSNRIFFAHQTFQWNSEAKGKATVQCVIIGFGQIDKVPKRIFSYENVRGEPNEIKVSKINPYLVEGPDIVIRSRQKPLSNVPTIGIGNKPIDGGHYLFTTEEKEEFLRLEPKAAKFMRRWIGSKEFINGYERWCLWLGEATPTEIKVMPHVMERIKAVQYVRLESKSPPTQKLAETPTRFHVENIPISTYMVVPEVSSERRLYVPIGFENPATLASNLVKIVPNASCYHLGILCSIMHNTWLRFVGGRLESRYRYSKDIVYNNYPWPEPSEGQKKDVEQKAQAVLDTRDKYPDSSLADLYDPLTMPPDLLKAHQALDKAVDKCYRKEPFKSEMERIGYLFERYRELVETN